MNCFKKLTYLVFSTVAITIASTAVSLAETPEMPMPKPTAEHQWLQQFVGKWESSVEGMDPVKHTVFQSKGIDDIKAVGDFWIVDDVKSTMMNTPFSGFLTLGYDPQKEKFISTWIDSMTSQLWNYEGTLNDTKKVLTLETEGHCPMMPDKLIKLKETLELKDPNHISYTSYMLDDNGQWTKIMSSNSTRIK